MSEIKATMLMTGGPETPEYCSPHDGLTSVTHRQKAECIEHALRVEIGRLNIMNAARIALEEGNINEALRLMRFLAATREP